MYKGISKRKFQYDGEAEENQQNSAATRRTKASQPLALQKSKSAAAHFSQNLTWYDERTLFRQILNNCGAKLSASIDQCCVLNCGSVKFVKSLSRELKNDGNIAEKIEDFIDGFRRYIRQSACFQAALRPTEVTAENGETICEDSIIRLLMKVDALQIRIADEVLEKCASLVQNGHSSSDIETARIIINQFRYLEHIVDSEAITVKFFDVLKLAKGEIQLEILTCLPELSDDTRHEYIAQKLRDFVKENEDLVVPILDTIGKLCLPYEYLTDIRETTISALKSYKPNDLPIVFRFLLQITKTPTYVAQLFSDLRSIYDFKEILLFTTVPNNTNKTKHAVRINDSRSITTDEPVNSGLECVTVFELALKYQKHIVDGALRYLEKEATTSELCLMDFIVLIILLNSSKKKSALNLLKSTIRSGALSDHIVCVFSENHLILKRYFKTVLEICENFVRICDTALNAFGCLLYRQCFLRLDEFYRQEVMSSLITHIGSGCSNEAMAALNALEYLIRNHPKEIAEFSMFIKNILDYIHTLNHEQSRKAFELLGILAQYGDDQSAEDESIMDELNLIIRKSIMCPTYRQRAHGVMCSAMVIKNLQGQKSAKFEELLKFTIKNVDHPSLRALFWEELAMNMTSFKFDEQNMEILRDHAIDIFTTKFVCHDSNKIKSLSERGKLTFENADKNKKYSIAIFIESINSAIDGSDDDSGVELCPLFRLLISCESALGQDLKKYYEFLDCPLITVKNLSRDTFINESADMKNSICRDYFHCINWIRELLSNFCGFENEKLKNVLLKRLRLLNNLQNDLERYVENLKSFTVPFAQYDKETYVLRPAAKSWKDKEPTKVVKEFTNGKKKGCVMKKKASISAGSVVSQKQTQNTDDMATKEDEPEPSSSKKKITSTKNNQSASPITIANFYRELDTSVLTLLKFSSAFDEATSKDVSNNNNSSLRIYELRFLLNDLYAKLKHRLPSSRKKAFWFVKTNLTDTYQFQRLDLMDSSKFFILVVSLLPNLFDHLKSCRDFIKDYSNKNDDDVDDNFHTTSKMYAAAYNCVDTTFLCLEVIFNWRGLSETKNEDLAKNLFKILSNHFLQASKAQTVNIISKVVIKHLLDYANVCNSLSSANNLLLILSRLSDFASCEEINENIAEISASFLKRDWSDSDEILQKGKISLIIKSVLRIYFSKNSENSLNVCETLIQTALSEATVDSGFQSETFKTINKNTFGAWYNALFHELTVAIKHIRQPASSDSQSSSEPLLLQWIQATRLFGFMISVLKNVELKPVLISAMREGETFLRIFVQSAMSLLDRSFSEQYENVRKLLSSVQKSTRLLLSLCLHAKVLSKDKSLARYVPALKKTMEELVYRVKAMMALNNCQDALSIANLKWRNLQGEEMHTQDFLQENEGDYTTTDNGETEEDNTSKKDETNEQDENSGDEEEKDDNDDEENDESVSGHESEAY